MPVSASNPKLPKSSFIDPKTLMSIRNLELRARVVVEGFWSGLHRSPYHGFSSEFTEYRQYTPDDDPRHLDWRVFARSDRYLIKKFEDETNLRCYLLCDQSRSMSYGSTGYSKAEFARRGDAQVESKVRPNRTAADQDKFVAIDIETGEYELEGLTEGRFGLWNNRGDDGRCLASQFGSARTPLSR